MKILKTFVSVMAVISMIGTLFISTGIDVSAKELSDEQIVSQVFDSAYYASNNADVLAAVGGNSKALLKHYMEHGIYEGRNASATFNATAYKNRYSDLQDAFGNDMLKYVRHYVNCGKAENRNAGPATTQNNPKTKGPNDKATYTCLGSYTTKLNPKAARATNIAIAASRVNGSIVQPGQEFSYSNTILPRTVENGYVEAPVFINKEHAMGIGGGICQVSSTLYACMKTIGLAATERHPHSLPVDYLPAGWDATVSGTTLDLKFVNTYSKPLMITSDSTDGRLTVSLWLQD